MRQVVNIDCLVTCLLFFMVTPSPMRAQSPPCGLDVVRTEGRNIDDRFMPFPPEHVKFALLRAFPAVAGKVTNEEGFHIQGEIDTHLYQVDMRKNKDEGIKGLSHGLGALGKFTVDIREATQDDVKGSQIHIEFHKNGFYGRAGSEGYAQPLGDETACLAKLLSTNDPVANPRGMGAPGATTPEAIALPDGTPLTVLLRDPLYSKTLSKDSKGATVNFEVANDVAVNGVVVIRRAALATGHFTDVEKTRNIGRHAEIGFAFDSVTAADGQTVAVVGAQERAKGGRTNDTAQAVQLGLIGLVFVHGTDVFIRAGTSYDLVVSGAHSIGGH